MLPSRELAKRIIIEILRQSAGNLDKTRLLKGFWLAHLFFSRKAKGYLSDWPIVRMPKGPGIPGAEELLDELIEEGLVERSYEPKGPFVEINCKLRDSKIESGLSGMAIEAIREAVVFVKEHTAESISELSHEFSRSWNNLPDGVEMNVYTDLIPDDVYRDRKEELIELKKAYEDLLK